MLYHGLGGGPDPYRSRIPASIARQSRFPNFCHLCPPYCSLSQYRLQCQEFGESNFPRRGSNPVSRQEILRFPESRTIFRSQGYKTITEMSGRKVIPGSWGKTHCLRLFILISQLKNETNCKVSFIHHHYLLCVNGTWISRIFKVMCERV